MKVISGGPSFVAMVKAPDLGQFDHRPDFCWLNGAKALPLANHAVGYRRLRQFNPSLSNSPCIRGAFQTGLARLIFPIRSRTSKGSPVYQDERGCFSKSNTDERKPLRCQTITVLGLTITRLQGEPPPTTPSQYVDLVAQGKILHLQRRAASEAGKQSRKQRKKHGSHGYEE